MKLNYNNYNLDDFLADDDFVNWVLDPTDETNAFWNQWVSEHPDKKHILHSAKAFVKNIYSAEDQFSNTEATDELWSKIKKETIDTSTNTTSTKIRKLNWLKYAAAVVLLFSASFYFLNQNPKANELASSEKSIWVLDENTSGVAKDIHLADGSTVTLEPYSSLKYPKIFSGQQRDVFLQGEAFFDIARDTTKPFLIYANETITKVLGTSFTIKAFEGDDDVEVIVKTGKVAVYAKVASENNKTVRKRMIVKADEEISVPLPNRKLEITPNQKVVFNKKKKELVRTIAPLPILIEKSVKQIKKFKFEEESVVEVFEAMELAYGLEINFNEEQLKNCTITTTLADMPMLNKIEIICEALTLKFEEKDGVIFIKGKGCS